MGVLIDIPIVILATLIGGKSLKRSMHLSE